MTDLEHFAQCYVNWARGQHAAIAFSEKEILWADYVSARNRINSKQIPAIIEDIHLGKWPEPANHFLHVVEARN